MMHPEISSIIMKDKAYQRKNYYAIQFEHTQTQYAADFYALPKRLYARRERMQDADTERALLAGNHILSKYFAVYPFLAYEEAGKAAARCVLTLYPDGRAYVGFFESIPDREAALCVLRAAEQLAAAHGCRSLTGSVDCSFWIRYRLKTDHFGAPYSGEPYNKAYYAQFFHDAGFTVSGMYFSNRYRRVPRGHSSAKAEKRLADFRRMGYEIVSPDAETFDRALRDVYGLLIELYSDFQTYSRITEEEFVALYAPLRHAADFSMVKLAYFRGRAVGFFVSIPNCGNAFNGRMTPCKLLRILKARLRCKDFVMLYMGADPAHLGLGTALAETIKQTLAEKGARSYGALIHRGKVSGGYFKDLVEDRFTYRLFEKQI